MRRSLCSATLLAATLALAACADDPASPAPGDEAPTPPVDQDLVQPTSGGKSDTGYLSNLAVEVEGVFESQLRIDLGAIDEAERAEWEALVEDDPTLVQTELDEQIKYAKNQINTAALHLNLSASDVEVTAAKVDEAGFLVVSYASRVETIITQTDLVDEGTTLETLLQQEYAAVLPDQAALMAEKVGTACLTADQTEAHAYNYFYYFQPDRAGCTEAMDAAGIARVGARLRLESLAPAETVYPEYDQLVADGRIDVVAFFGAANYDWEPGKWDWGVYQRDLFQRDLTARGFDSEATDEGQLFHRTSGGLEQYVMVVGPETLKSLKDDADGLFERMVRENEIIFYNGHSFYGSLDVLEKPTLYPGKYQIFFMNSCWSYEYYTKQIFKQNATEADPEGWLLADVVNDTESGWFHNMAGQSRILLANLLRGAETGGREGDRYYTWDRIIGAMNDHAIEVYKDRRTETHEIYGVSGVRTNRFEPAE